MFEQSKISGKNLASIWTGEADRTSTALSSIEIDTQHVIAELDRQPRRLNFVVQYLLQCCVRYHD